MREMVLNCVYSLVAFGQVKSMIVSRVPDTQVFRV